MKICMLTTSYPRHANDYAGTFVHQLAKELVKQGGQVRIVAPGHVNTRTKEVADGVIVERFRYFWPTKFQRLAYGAGIPTNMRTSWLARLQVLPFVTSFFIAAGRAIRKGDLIHAHWVEPALLGLIWKGLLKKPLVVSLHRFNPGSQVYKKLYEVVLDNADDIIFNSSYTYNRATIFMRAQKGAIIPPGIDLDRFPSKWNEKKSAQYNVAASRRQIVFGLGSLLPVKGFIHLIEAMPSILKHIDCHFVIGGQGPERENLMRKAEELGVQGNLTLSGQVSTSDVPELMRRADVFVLPSVPHSSGDTEALGMVLVEALASGTPCVASRVGGIIDIVEDDVNGYLIAPGNAEELAKKIVLLLQDEIRRIEMGKAGRLKIEAEYSLPAVTQRVMAVYQSLLPVTNDVD